VNVKGPEFIRFFKPILQILKQSGGSGTTSEVIDRAIELLQIPESEQEVTLKNGQSRVRNQVQWGRLYLVRAGYLESSRRGVWSLTEKGAQTDLARFDAYEVFQLVQKGLRAEKKKKKELEEPFIDERDESSADLSAYAREFFVNQVFRRSLLPEKLAMAASTELGCCKSIHSSVLTFYFSANVIKVPSLPLKFVTFEEPWQAVRTRVL